jgi:hypothetical protein
LNYNFHYNFILKNIRNSVTREEHSNDGNTCSNAIESGSRARGRGGSRGRARCGSSGKGILISI